MNLLSNQDQEVHAVSQVKPKKAYPDAQAGTSSSQVASHELSTFSDASNPSFSLASATADAAGHSSIVSGATQVSFIFYFMYVLLFFFFLLYVKIDGKQTKYYFSPRPNSRGGAFTAGVIRLVYLFFVS